MSAICRDWTRHLEKAVGYRFEKNRVLIIIILALTLLFAFTSQRIRFNGDISTLNYLTERLGESEARLKSISSVANSSVYLVTQGETMEEVLVPLYLHHRFQIIRDRRVEFGCDSQFSQLQAQPLAVCVQLLAGR